MQDPKKKNVSLACLECRRRHVRCDGELPICVKCRQNGRECVYTVSHRGGPRIPKSQLKVTGDFNSVSMPINANNGFITFQKSSSTAGSDTGMDGTSSRPFLSTTSSSESSSVQTGPRPSTNLIDSDLEGPSPIWDSSADFLLKQLTSDNQVGSDLQTSQFTSLYSTNVPTPSTGTQSYSTPMTPNSLDLESSGLSAILSNYYTYFHHRHPFLPGKSSMIDYLRSSGHPYDLISIMEIVGVVTSTSQLIDDPVMQEKVHNLYQLTTTSPNDLIKLQCLFLLSIFSHAVMMREFGEVIRKDAVDLALLVVDSSTNTTDFSVLLSSPRMENLNSSIVEECIQRTFHDLIFIDILISARNANRVSLLKNIGQSIPVVDLPFFAYNFRFKSLMVFNDIVEVLTSQEPSSVNNQQFSRLDAVISTWQGYLKDPLLIGAPEVIDSIGRVNDGIHQAVVVINFAAILLHLPFSLLSQNCEKIPNYLECGTGSGPPPGPYQSSVVSNSKGLVSSGKCIEAANILVEMASTLGVQANALRSPVYPCILALGCLVHMKAYDWLKKTALNNASGGGPIHDELVLYEQSMRLQLDSLNMMGNQFFLAKTLELSLLTLIQHFLPEIHEKLSQSTPEPTIFDFEDSAYSDMLISDLNLGFFANFTDFVS